MRPDLMWEKYFAAGGIDKTWFDSYFGDTQWGYGIMIGETHQFKSFLEIDSLGFSAPQFYKYISEDELKKLCELGG